jgi:hypothetical protein
MSSDPNKKSARNFQCRDMLWDTFEQMARELECSVDYLINEAMKQYARQRNFAPGGGAQSYDREPPPRERPEPRPDPRSRGGGSGYGSAPPPPVGRSGLGGPPARGGGGGLPPPPARPSQLPAPPPPPRGAMGGGGPSPIGGGMRGGNTGGPMMGRNAPPSAPRSAPPPIPPQRGGSMPPIPGGGGMMNGGYGAQQHNAQLTVIYQGEKVPVTKDRFVIGRGKQSSDLTLKDPNVSRQHAMIEYQNGVYFMVDMGSTNGVEYNGQRIARKQIAEGDVFRICDHDLRFTYR